MRQFIFAVTITTFFCLTTYGQSNEVPCQKIIINAPKRANPEEIFKVSATFENDSQNSTVFNWTIIKGEQLTKSSNANFIEIKANEPGNFSPIIILADSVEPKCQKTAMVNIYTANNIDFTNLDEFGKAPWPEERARLDLALIAMNQDKEMSLFIFYNYDKKSQAQVKSHLLRALNYLAEKGKLARERIVFLLSEADEEKTVFQLVSQNSDWNFCNKCTLIRGENFEKIINLFSSQTPTKKAQK